MPLAGIRIVVKDNIHIKGTKVSQGNKAFYDTFPPQQQNAECIQRLLEQGAMIIGKAKMNSFGNWEEAVEYIDYQAPWNPRGDGYQSTGGSSSGCAAAVAAYDWVDAAIGTDSLSSLIHTTQLLARANVVFLAAWGSVTRPAQWCGVFGLRPSLGTVSTTGIEPFCQ